MLAAKNAAGKWTSILIMTVVGIFLTPFVLHRIGDAANGIYFLIISLTGYYGLLELGIRSSIIKYVAEADATQDDEHLSRVVNTTLVTYAAIAIVILIMTAVGALYVSVLFHISPSFFKTAQWLFVIAGTGLALSLPLGVFSGVLEGMQKFYYATPIEITGTLLRAGLVVFYLERGYGVIAVVLITVAINAVGYNVGCFFVATRVTRIRWGLAYVTRETFGEIIRYGLSTSSVTLSSILRGGWQNVLIGIFLSPSAITFFSIASKLAGYLSRLVQNLATTFMPLASYMDAAGETGKLRRLFIEGNRVCAFISLPFSALMIIFGKPIIAFWVGPEYVAHSYVVLVITVIPAALWFSQATSTRILYGMSQQQWLAKVFLVQGAAGLALAVLLIHSFGIAGVAMGTAVPSAILSLFVLAPHLCRVLKAPLMSSLSETYIPPLALSVPLVALSIVLQRFWPARSLIALLLELGCSGLVYGIGLLWLFVTKEPIGIQMWGRVMQSLPKPFTR
ncbi:MAG: lipopolysaccharide biosynthesis protein [Terriglobia bacterium]